MTGGWPLKGRPPHRADLPLWHARGSPAKEKKPLGSLAEPLATAGGDGSKLKESGYYWSSTLTDVGAKFVYLDEGNTGWLVNDGGDNYLVRACLAF